MWQQADNCQKLMNLPLEISKQILTIINAHTKFGKNPLIVTQVIIRKQKYRLMNLPLEITKQILTISMHIPSLVKIH